MTEVADTDTYSVKSFLALKETCVVILIKNQRQDRDIVPDKGFKMLVDGPLDHGALSRNLYFVFREQMIRLAELRTRERGTDIGE